MLLHDISIHIFMPAGIETAGYIAENVEKPEITKKIEESDKVIGAEECAEHLIRGTSSRLVSSVGDLPDVFGDAGLEKGYYQPTSYWITDLMRMQSRGAVPGNNVLLDTMHWVVSGVSGSFSSQECAQQSYCTVLCMVLCCENDIAD